jgi:hypothetical protein
MHNPVGEETMTGRTLAIEFDESDDWLKIPLVEGDNILSEPEARVDVVVREGQVVNVRAIDDQPSRSYFVVQRDFAAAARGEPRCFFCIERGNKINCKRVPCPKLEAIDV